MSALFSKTSAIWLIALLVVPFTAPLSTCDLSDLLARDRVLGTHQFSKAPPTRSLTHTALDHILPVGSGAPRSRLSAIDRLQTPPVFAIANPHAFRGFGSSADPDCGRPVAFSVLRI